MGREILEQIRNLSSNPSLKRLVYEELQRMIIQGKLAPGSKLTEEELARTMNISRAPIREALNMLDRDQFVKIIPRKGAVVTDVSTKDARDIWKCRLVLEPYAAKEATPRLPRPQLLALLEKVEQLEKEPYRIENHIQNDWELHSLYHKYTGNDRLQSILGNLQAHAARIRWLWETENSSKADPEAALQEHKAILEAFLAGDADMAYWAVQQHMKKAGRRLFDTWD